jgi:hypothetical protein
MCKRLKNISFKIMLNCPLLWLQLTFLNQEITPTCEQNINKNETQFIFSWAILTT